MVKVNIIYLTVVSVIAINSLALAGGQSDDTSDDFLSEGRSGSIKAIQIEKALESPDKTFKADGRTYKILNEHIPAGLIQEMADGGESISGKVQQTLGPNGIGWQFHYDVPATYDEGDNLMWSLHPTFTGSTVDFQIEDITRTPPAWYEFWRYGE